MESMEVWFFNMGDFQITSLIYLHFLPLVLHSIHLQALLMFTSERERAGASVPRPRKVVLTLRSDNEVAFEGKDDLGNDVLFRKLVTLWDYKSSSQIQSFSITKTACKTSFDFS